MPPPGASADIPPLRVFYYLALPRDITCSTHFSVRPFRDHAFLAFHMVFMDQTFKQVGRRGAPVLLARLARFYRVFRVSGAGGFDSGEPTTALGFAFVSEWQRNVPRPKPAKPSGVPMQAAQ